MSSLSAGTGGGLDVWELRETELSDGDNRPVFRTTDLGDAAVGAGGARFFPFPRTRPPPKLRRFAIVFEVSLLCATGFHFSIILFEAPVQPLRLFASSPLQLLRFGVRVAYSLRRMKSGEVGSEASSADTCT